MLQTKFTLIDVPAKKAAFTLLSSKPDIGPQSSPSARAAMIRYAPCSEELRSAVVSINCCLPANHDLASTCGNSCGNFSYTSISMPMIAVAGAARVFSAFPGDMQAASLSFDSCDFANTKRAGELFAEVGPHFHNS